MFLSSFFSTNYEETFLTYPLIHSPYYDNYFLEYS